MDGRKGGWMRHRLSVHSSLSTTAKELLRKPVSTSDLILETPQVLPWRAVHPSNCEVHKIWFAFLLDTKVRLCYLSAITYLEGGRAAVQIQTV